MHDLVYTIYSALALVLLVASSPPHWRAGNIGAIALVSWSFVKTFGYFVSSIVWWDSLNNSIPVWCDIDVKITSGLQIGLASATLCINRRLAIISSVKRATVSANSRRRSRWIDIAIVTIPPVLIMIISYCRQGARYTIQEAYGCGQYIYNDVYALLGLYLPPLLVGLASFCYGGIALYNFVSRRRHFQAVMQNSNSSLNTGRFLRLIALSSVEMLLSVPFSVWVLAQNSKVLYPSDSWADVHYQFSRIFFFSLDNHSVDARTYALANFTRWVPVFTAFLYFAFFGMQEEAMSGYASGWATLVEAGRRVGRWVTPKPSSQAESNPNDAYLPKLGTSVASPTETGWSKGMGYEEEQFGMPTEEERKGAEEEWSRSRIAVKVEVERHIV